MSENKTFSRRDLLTLKPLRDSLGVTEVNQEVKEASMEGLSNIIIGATLFHLAWAGSRDKLLKYSVDSERRLDTLHGFEDKLQKTIEMRVVVHEFLEKVKALYSKWEDAYYVTKTVPDDDPDTPELETKTVTEWEEPPLYTSKGLNHRYLKGLQDTLDLIDKRLAELEHEAHNYFDLSNGDRSIFYEESVEDKSKQFRISGVAYGLVATMFMLYEEGLDYGGRFFEQRYGNSVPGGLVDSRRNVSRRAAIKMIAAFLGVIPLRKIQKKFALKNETVLDEIRENAGDVVSQMDVNAEQNFKRYFGISVEGLFAKIENAEKIFNSCKDIPGFRVKKQITDAAAAVTRSRSAYDSYFGGDSVIPEALTEITKYAWGSEKMIGFTARKATDLRTRHWLNAAALGLGFAGVAALSEFLLIPASEQLSPTHSRIYRK